MSDVHNQVEQYAGDNALDCMNGTHSYTNGICTWCDRHTPPRTDTPHTGVHTDTPA